MKNKIRKYMDVHILAKPNVDHQIQGDVINRIACTVAEGVDVKLNIVWNNLWDWVYER